jgi:hypothetical protein
MGLHCGVGEEDISFNRQLGRTQYGGPAMAMTKASRDAPRTEAVVVTCALGSH